MTAPRTCSRCGAPLPADTDECPRCLLRLGLQLPPRDPSGGPASDAPPAAPTGAGPSRRPVPLPLEDIARRFPSLEIKALIGQGGMGMVYRARQPRLDREVALKVLPPELSADAAFAERFLREARAMARLAHPNIVAVHDFGETDGVCWLMMELVDGVNLRQALREGALPPEKALAVVPQMCDALQYAHDEGVVHRDIKPENVLLDRGGRVKIADFGLAKLLGPQDVTLTTETQVFGTPHYMAPEQMEGARDVDHRADIFSLGVVFYEMLTGRLPVGRFEPPSRRVRVDVRLDDVVLHALEHEPARRYQHAAEVKTDVESVAAGKEPDVAHGGARAEAVEHGLGQRPHNFAGVWLEWPRRKKRPDVRAAVGQTTGGTAGVHRMHSYLWGLQVGWVVLSMFVWSVFVWRIAGEMAAQGAAGVAGGALLLTATAWVFLQIFVHARLPLRDALAAESHRARACRLMAAAACLFGGFLFFGHGIVEDWEHGTRHYVSDARDRLHVLEVDPATLEGALSNETWSLLQPADDGPTPGESWALGLALMVAAGAAATVRLRGPGPRSSLAALLGVPVLLLLGLGTLTLWTSWRHPMDYWPSLAPVEGSVQLDLHLDDASAALRSALRADGYSERRSEVMAAGLGTSATAAAAFLAFEPEAPWDRWSLEDGLPRRRRPHVTLQLVRRGEGSVVEWSCGHVRPVAGEAAAWTEWLQRILREAPRFAGSSAGG